MDNDDRCVVLNRFGQALSQHCPQHLLEEKWLIAPSRRIGHQWLQSLARGGYASVNVRVKTIRSIAFEIALPKLLANGVTAASPSVRMLIIDRAVRHCRKDQLKYLNNIALGATLAEKILDSIEAIRLAGLSAVDLTVGRFEVSLKGEDLAAILEVYLQLLKQEKMVDYAEVLHMAIHQLADPSPCLGEDVLVLVPEDLACTALETDLLNAVTEHRRINLSVDMPAGAESPPDPVESDLQLMRWLLRPGRAPQSPADGSVRIVRAVGAVNEVRHVLRYCLAHDIPLDEVELLHTDAQAYVPLVYETLTTVHCGHHESREIPDIPDFPPAEGSDDDLPVTFTQGIPCRYARAGRALLLWLRWIQGGFQQMPLVRMLNEGVLAIPDNVEQRTGFSRLAKLLQGVGIGFGRDRYRPNLDAQIEAMERRINSSSNVYNDETLAPSQRVHLERDLHDMRVIREIIGNVIDLTAPDDASPHQVVTSAQRFLECAARSVNKLDQFASEKLVMELSSMAEWLARTNEDSSINIWQWLSDLPITTCVLGSGPQPGRLHVDSVHAGGHSGRRHTFIVGLDDSRFPGARSEDPLLLDGERRRLSRHLYTTADQVEQRLENFVGLLARLRGQVHLSFSCRSIDDEREMFPSLVLLSIYRLLSGNPQAQQSDLLNSLPAPASFAPIKPVECLDVVEWWFWRLSGPQAVKDPKDLVFSQFAHLGRGCHAQTQRAGPAFTAYDGYVPTAGSELDPTAPKGPLVSAHMMEAIGICPRRFFFRYALDIKTPDDVTVQPDQWLDGRTSGALMHSVFEKLIHELVNDHHLPNYDRDCNRLDQIVDQTITKHKDHFPPPSESAFYYQLHQLRQTAHIFLREEEQYCAKYDAVPTFVEASIGMQPEHHGTPVDTTTPVSLSLGNGVTIRTRGRIDRIDRIGQGSVNTFSIWDYKTGGDRGYDRSNPFQQGRKMQPYLYMTMVGHCLRRFISPDAEVQYFGFFFPGVKSSGRRIKWTPDELVGGKQIIEHLCRIVSGGAFIATNESKDCVYCEYQSICGDLPALARASQQKLNNPNNTSLSPFLTLRAAE